MRVRQWHEETRWTGRPSSGVRVRRRRSFHRFARVRRWPTETRFASCRARENTTETANCAVTSDGRGTNRTQWLTTSGGGSVRFSSYLPVRRCVRASVCGPSDKTRRPAPVVPTPRGPRSGRWRESPDSAQCGQPRRRPVGTVPGSTQPRPQYGNYRATRARRTRLPEGAFPDDDGHRVPRK